MNIETTQTTPALAHRNISVSADTLTYLEQKISLTDVTTIRFGWIPVEVYHFWIGGRYIIELGTEDKKMKIDFSYWFGLFKKRQSENFNTLLNSIWDLTVARLVDSMINQIEKGEEVCIGKCRINNAGIIVKDLMIPWLDLSYQANYNRLTLNSKSRASLWTNLYYTETDNVYVLRYFLQWKFENINGA